MNYKDYYGELGIQKNATPAEIKKAYRKFANKYHPDKTNGDKSAEEKFKTINEANEVLSDPEKRKKYDQFGTDWKQYEEAGAKPGGFDWSKYSSQQGGQAGSTNSDPFDGMFTNENTGDLFEMLFGQRGTGQRRGRRTAVSKGDDLAAETTLSLEEAYNGAVRLLQLNSQTIKISIKPGVADNQKLRIPGKGRTGSNGGQNGDLFLTVRIASHPTFRRSGDDLSCILPVKLYTAILGGKVQLGTFKGNLNVDIPAGTPNGKVLKLRGMGMPVYAKKNEFGNMLVKIEIQLPESLSDEELDLFRKLAALKK